MNHYNARSGLALTEREQGDLVEYLKSPRRRDAEGRIAPALVYGESDLPV